MAEFLRQIGVADDFKEAGFRRLGQPLKINGPDFIGIAVFPLGQFLRVINGPGIGDVMHRADEIIPRMPRGESANPVLVTGQIIHLQREADGELRKILLRLADFGDVFIELTAYIRQLSKSSCGIGEWSEKPISVRPRAMARAAYSPGSPVAWRQSGVCMW